jgi:2-ketoarginine methyltransferase
MTVGEIELTTSGQDDLFSLAKGYYTTRALLAIWRLGLLERAAAGEELDAAAIAAEHGVEVGLIQPILDYLIVRGFLERVSPGVYRLTARALAARPYYGYLSTMVGAYEPVFSRIEDLATGKLRYGRDIVRDHEEMARGLTSLEDRLMNAVPEVVRAHGATKVLDLGCGSAQMLAKICQIDPGIRAVGVDRDPNSLAVARETVERDRLGDRVTLVQGDATDVKALPADALAGVDMVTVMFLLHEILRQRGRDGTVALLRDIASIVGPGGHLGVVEVSGTTEPTYREDLLFVPEYELLHEYTNQRLAARPEWEAMVNDAGMRVVQFAPLDMCQAFCMVTEVESTK